jgi:hypothetical protein
MKKYYKTCPNCGANLDPEEKCDCKGKDTPIIKIIEGGYLEQKYIKAKLFPTEIDCNDCFHKDKENGMLSTCTICPFMSIVNIVSIQWAMGNWYALVIMENNKIQPVSLSRLEIIP